MTDLKNDRSPLFRSPVRTLNAEEMARVAGGSPKEGLSKKPVSTPIDIEGFR